MGTMNVHECITCAWVRVWGQWQLMPRESDLGGMFALFMVLLLCNVLVTCVVRGLVRKMLAISLTWSEIHLILFLGV